MIVQRRAGPTYAPPGKDLTANELRKLGCSEALVAYLAPAPARLALKHPREWFWMDRGWFKNASRGVTDEIAAFAGGFFCELPLKEQAAMLGIPIVSMPGTKVRGGRGLWKAPSGKVIQIEALALELCRKPGERGASYEGMGVKASWLMTAKTFETMHGYRMGWDPTNRDPYQPSATYAARVLSALDTVLANPARTFQKHRAYLQQLLGSMTEADAIEWCEIVGATFIRGLFEHCFTVGTTAQAGHPDLTISGCSLRFLEVKGKDRMHANQAGWILDIAKPLSLDVSLIQIV